MKKFKVSIVIDTKKTHKTTIEAQDGVSASEMALNLVEAANWVTTSTTTMIAKE